MLEYRSQATTQKSGYNSARGLEPSTQPTIPLEQKERLDRDITISRFRDPVLWQDQNWQRYPDNHWRRESMLWYCKDVIYGKASRVNILDSMGKVYTWLILFVWLSYNLIEFRESFKFSVMTWAAPTRSASDAYSENREDNEILILGLNLGTKFFMTLLIILPRLAQSGYVAYLGTLQILDDDRDQHLADKLILAMELAFILTFGEFVYLAFVSYHKKQQISNMVLPVIRVRGFARIFNNYSDFPRVVIIAAIASYFCMAMPSHALNGSDADVISAKEAGVIEGCCNFVQYLKGSGEKVLLSQYSPCSVFREKFEKPAGIPIPPVETHPEESQNITLGSASLVQLGEEVVHRFVGSLHRSA